MSDTSWRELLEEARQAAADESAIVAYAPDEASFDVHLSRRLDVLAWSTRRVYFPVVYDGAEWIGSAPRNPVTEGQPPVGGQ